MCCNNRRCLFLDCRPTETNLRVNKTEICQNSTHLNKWDIVSESTEEAERQHEDHGLCPPVEGASKDDGRFIEQCLVRLRQPGLAEDANDYNRQG